MNVYIQIRPSALERKELPRAIFGIELEKEDFIKVRKNNFKEKSRQEGGGNFHLLFGLHLFLSSYQNRQSYYNFPHHYFLSSLELLALRKEEKFIKRSSKEETYN